MGVLDVFKDLAEGAMPGWRANQERKSQEIDAQRKRQAEDLEFAQHITGAGGRAIVNGAVKDDLTLPSGTTIPGGLLRKAGDNGRSIIKHKTAEGETVQYELPTPEEQIQTHATRLMQQFLNEAPVRQGQAQEAATNAGNLSRAQRSGTLQADNEEANTHGLAVPSVLNDLFGIDTAKNPEQDVTKNPDGTPRKLLPASLDAFLTAGGKFADLTSKADARNGAPAKKIHTVAPSVDDEGNQTEVITYDDGTVEEKPLTAKGKATKPDEIALSVIVARGKNSWATPKMKAAAAEAEAALERLDKSKREARPVTNNQFTAPTTGAAATQSQVKIDDVPDNVRGTVQRIINGDQAMPPLSRNNPTNQAIQYWVGKVDPGYTASRSDLKKSFVSGKDADNVKSLNTVIGHLGSLYESAGSLDNTTIKKYNSFGNWLSREAGSPTTAAFRVDRRGVASELSTALKGGVASQAEVEGWLKEIDDSDSPATLKATTAEIANVIGSRMDALEGKRGALPEASRSTPLLSEKSAKVLTKLSGGGSQKKYANTATGPNGHKVGTNDGGKTWYDVQTGAQVK